MQNGNADFQNLKRIKHFNPLFDHCYKALNSTNENYSSQNNDFSDIKKSYCYLVIPNNAQLSQKLFQCKSICPVFNSGSESFILVKGQNLWDFYRAKKENQIILTEQQIWILIKQIIQALIQLSQFGYFHTHLKEYAIYRQSSYSYQLIFHSEIKSMLQLAQSNNFYWYDFYLSPEELKANTKQKYLHSQKQQVFSFGLLILNVMNAQDFNRDAYSRKDYEIDWEIIQSKIQNSKNKYSDRLRSLVTNCLKRSPQQRYGLKQIYNETLNLIQQNKTLNLQFKSKFDQLISSRLKMSQNKKSPKISNSNQKKQRNSSSKRVIACQDTQNNKNKQHSSIDKQNKIKTFQSSPPKKWKVLPVQTQKKFKISKQNIVSKQQISQKNKLRKKSNQKLKQSNKNENLLIKEKKIEDVINFERGTFGGDQDQILFSFTPNKLKKQDKINIQGEQNKYKKADNQQLQNHQAQKCLSFGSMNPQNSDMHNSKDSIDSQIQILDALTLEQKQLQKNSPQIKFTLQKEVQLPKFSQPKLIKNQYQKNYSLQNLKQHSKNFDIHQLKRIINHLNIKLKQIKLQTKDCLQPLQILQKSVSQTPGIFINGNLYFGPFKNGRRNGFGLQVFPQNQYYLGNFKDDLFHGQGFYFWNKNQYFSGIFENGKKIFGNLYGPKLHYFGAFQNSKKMNGHGKAKYKTGEQYIGQWKDGKKNGIGELTQITKDKFIGFWKKGKKDGYGEHISQGYPEEGYILKSFWKNHQIIGDAIIEYCNGNIYQGGLNDFEKNGKGLFTFKKGGYFKGTFYKDNATHGQLLYKNGQKYIGSLKNMKRHGFGQYHYLDGTIKKGNWIEDIRVQKQVDLKSIT